MRVCFHQLPYHIHQDHFRLWCFSLSTHALWKSWMAVCPDFTLQMMMWSKPSKEETGSLSLAIPPWVDTLSTGNDFGNHMERNSKFCLTVGPLAMTAGMLALVNCLQLPYMMQCCYRMLLYRLLNFQTPLSHTLWTINIWLLIDNRHYLKLF